MPKKATSTAGVARLCEKCVKECKQTSAAQVVTCPGYKTSVRNLEMFDSQGEVSSDMGGKKKKTRRRK